MSVFLPYRADLSSPEISVKTEAKQRGGKGDENGAEKHRNKDKDGD